MLEQGYQTELLKKIDKSLLAKVEPLEPPPLLAYLDDHLNEERYYQDWQKIFFELGHIYNKADGHAENRCQATPLHVNGCSTMDMIYRRDV